MAEKATLEAANRPPLRTKEKERKDQSVGTVDNMDACQRTVRMLPLCMMKLTQDIQNEEYEYYDEESDWTDRTGALTYDDWSYGDCCDCCQDPCGYDDSDWQTDGWYDHWTWETEHAPTASPALSQPQPHVSSSSLMEELQLPRRALPLHQTFQLYKV